MLYFKLLHNYIFGKCHVKERACCISVPKSACVCKCVWKKGEGTHCIHTEAGNGLESGLEADLFQAKVAVPEQTTPKEHPVQAGAVVHDDYASLPRNEAVSSDHHLHPKHQLQQSLPGRETEGT